ncbi:MULTISPECIES: hypothetical protein [unclassified Mesorhizobium]|uniref:hypothetical protein n=1 Tax=unclassified Mesorhizobium TaxID=325217 RepID=UPI000FCA9FD9|nr:MULTISPECIES: hypothetical protein [unclassified Mesorhizobium]TGP26099.1 hypothetical protein EN875_034205 [Mesorhizobium sp. M2D.F.Ca.ET.232.01.1.1]TGQ24097.1 hypothetical protein EN863_063690 [Mesorhizobium sp. M00.F.Ca.ET.220.01.1.1]TGT95953.1 hypothetical protein EN806_53425 [bacterium M00.F.Ca.ET.163.01.1.1]
MEDIWDGPWKLFEHDPATGRSVWMMMQDDQTVFRIDMPIQGILDSNHEREMETMGNRFGDYRPLASVPLPLFHANGLAEAAREKDDTFLKRWLNDGDFKKFRTSRGNV